MTYTLQIKIMGSYKRAMTFNTLHGAKTNSDDYYNNKNLETRVLDEAGAVVYIPESLDPTR